MAEPIVTTQTAPKSKTDVTTETRRQPPYNVIILNDEEHTFDYVIELLVKLFAHSLQTAKDLTWRIHTSGPGGRVHDPQGEGRAEARAGPGLRSRPADEHLERAARLLHRAGAERLKRGRRLAPSALRRSPAPTCLTSSRVIPTASQPSFKAR